MKTVLVEHHNENVNESNPNCSTIHAIQYLCSQNTNLRWNWFPIRLKKTYNNRHKSNRKFYIIAQTYSYAYISAYLKVE